MHPEDRVLVAVMNRPKDFEIVQREGWYRLPRKQATAGAFFEYVAFYFTATFGEQAYGVHYYARRLGHELVTRRDLLPDEPDHPRAEEQYYKLQLGPLQKREPPIVSRRWRRITFVHTTWDRFEAAQEINDLFAEGGEFVDRLYHALRDSGLSPERHFPVREAGAEYVADLALPCHDGVLSVSVAEGQPGREASLCFSPRVVVSDMRSCVIEIQREVERRGGIQPTWDATGKRSQR
jgi:hypothetical protein